MEKALNVKYFARHLHHHKVSSAKPERLFISLLCWQDRGSTRNLYAKKKLEASTETLKSLRYTLQCKLFFMKKKKLWVNLVHFPDNTIAAREEREKIPRITTIIRLILVIGGKKKFVKPSEN